MSSQITFTALIGNVNNVIHGSPYVMRDQLQRCWKHLRRGLGPSKKSGSVAYAVSMITNSFSSLSKLVYSEGFNLFLKI
jgi:hypothetical protein